MPSLFRFVLILAVLGGAVFAGMIALVTFVTVQPHSIEQAIPASRLK